MAGDWPRSILIVGCGNMGGAMLAGWLAGGLDPVCVTVVDPVLESAPEGVTLLRELPDIAPDALLVGVKPQMLHEIAPTLAPLAQAETVVLSILAGVDRKTLRGHFPDALGVVRVMPNLAAAIGKSPIALAQEGLDGARAGRVLALMHPLGTPEWIAESEFDLVTALAGSGPGFVYRFIDALAGGARELGLGAAQAERLAIAMVEGASALAAASAHPPGELADRVASPGGTTRAGLDVLDRDDTLARIVAETLRAARDRSAQMTREAQK